MPPITDLRVLIGSMVPVLNHGTYVFATVPAGKSLPEMDIVSSIREAEGLSVIVASDVAVREGLESAFPCAWITLQVHSDLAAVGLTAACAAALAAAGISCNVVAGMNHDHLFVPHAMAENAMTVLRGLQRAGTGPSAAYSTARTPISRPAPAQRSEHDARWVCPSRIYPAPATAARRPALDPSPAPPYT